MTEWSKKPFSDKLWTPANTVGVWGTTPNSLYRLKIIGSLESNWEHATMLLSSETFTVPGDKLRLQTWYVLERIVDGD